jgi:hypothetical protein
MPCVILPFLAKKSMAEKNDLLLLSRHNDRGAALVAIFSLSLPFK